MQEVATMSQRTLGKVWNIWMLTKLGGVKKNKKCIFFKYSQKTNDMELSEIQFWRAPCFLFLKNLKNKYTFCFFWRHLTFVNISIFHTFPRVLWDIVATSCMLPYKCHTYLESLWSLLFVGISQHDAMLIRIEENWVWSPKADFFNFLTVSDIF